MGTSRQKPTVWIIALVPQLLLAFDHLLHKKISQQEIITAMQANVRNKIPKLFTNTQEAEWLIRLSFLFTSHILIFYTSLLYWYWTDHFAFQSEQIHLKAENEDVLLLVDPLWRLQEPLNQHILLFICRRRVFKMSSSREAMGRYLGTAETWNGCMRLYDCTSL